jgi:hypothetical protein
VAIATKQTGVVLQSWVSPALAEALKAQAELERRSISATIRLAVEEQTAQEAGPMSGDWWINLPRDRDDPVFADGSPAVNGDQSAAQGDPDSVVSVLTKAAARRSQMGKVLLRQPGGFEGVVSLAVRRPADDPSVAERPHVEEGVPDLGIASLQPSAIADGGYDMGLVGVDHLGEVDPEVVERFPVLAQRRLGGLDAVDDPEIRGGLTPRSGAA